MRIGILLTALAVALGPLVGSTRAFAGPSSHFNYVYEIWYEVERDMGAQLDLYFAKLKELRESRPRWVDAHHESNRRIVSLPAEHLGDYRGERYNEAGLRALLGEDAYRELSKSYAEAQLYRRSYIREYRTDLSLNRDRYTRSGMWATEYILITVEPGKDKQFERTWRTAMSAYAKVLPHAVLVVAKTIVGGGPQYAVTRPVATAADLDSLPSLAEVVERAIGSEESRKFKDRFSQSVNKWEKLVLVRTNLDASGATPAK